uniref:Putative bZIP transcription factor 53 n=1 Tax=Davidia involucrata TaxID=16924 RepID=A0A5B6YJA1_DAVIN
MSSLKQVRSSSSSDGDPKYATMDERKRKRMISNRESAKRSRMRKQKLVEDLTNEATQIQNENNRIVGKIDSTTEMYMAFALQNNDLRAQAMELTERLRSLNHVLRNSGLAVDIPEIPDPLLKPWQLLRPLQPVMASSDFFQF